MATRLRRTLRICAASLGVLVGALGADGLAESAGPIRLAVGAPAGGSIDVYSRIIAEHMSATLGRPVIIEIKAGANGNLAAQWVADGPADGSQVWVAAQSMIEINPSSYRNLRWKRSDFIPVIKGIETPLVLVAHPSVPATTFEQWVDWAKANPQGGHAGRRRQAAGGGRDRGACRRGGAGAARGPGLRGERRHRRRVRAEHRSAVRALGEDREGDGLFGDGVAQSRVRASPRVRAARGPRVNSARPGTQSVCRYLSLCVGAF
jgi:hypothetical protein